MNSKNIYVAIPNDEGNVLAIVAESKRKAIEIAMENYNDMDECDFRVLNISKSLEKLGYIVNLEYLTVYH